jgi:hypothetical protein
LLVPVRGTIGRRRCGVLGESCRSPSSAHDSAARHSKEGPPASRLPACLSGLAVPPGAARPGLFLHKRSETHIRCSPESEISQPPTELLVLSHSRSARPPDHTARTVKTGLLDHSPEKTTRPGRPVSSLASWLCLVPGSTTLDVPSVHPGWMPPPDPSMRQWVVLPARLHPKQRH